MAFGAMKGPGSSSMLFPPSLQGEVRSLAKRGTLRHCPRYHRGKEDRVVHLGPYFQIVSDGYIRSAKLRNPCYKEFWEM